MVLLMWLPMLFALFFGFGVLSHLFALVAVVPLYYLSVKNLLRERMNIRKELLGAVKSVAGNKVFLVIYTLLAVLWVYLIYTHNLRPNDAGGLSVGQSTFGDINIHLGFITTIANQKSIPSHYNIFPEAILSYPFLAECISASMYVCGASLRFAYSFPMVGAFLALTAAFYMLSSTILKSKGKSVLAFLFFFFNGGFGALYFINWSNEGKYHFKDIFTEYYKTPTNLTDENIRWVNVIIDMLLPQRTFLFGMTVLVCAIYLLFRAYESREKKYFILAGILGGALPLIHTHSFVAFVLIAGGMILNDLYTNAVSTDSFWKKKPQAVLFVFFIVLMETVSGLLKKEILLSGDLMILFFVLILAVLLAGIVLLVSAIKKGRTKELLSTVGCMLGITVIMALPQIFGFTLKQAHTESGFFEGHFNWANLGDGYIFFYLKNMGVVLILYVLSLFEDKKDSLFSTAPVFLLFIATELIKYQPLEYDNNKILYAAYIFIAVKAADYAVDLYQKIKIGAGGKLLAALILVSCFMSALLSIGREAVSDYEVYGRDHVEMAKWIEDNTQVTDLFLTNNRHNNTVSSLTGRDILCGSANFLWTHGFSYDEYYADIRRMYESPKSFEDLFNRYGIDYVCVSEYELNDYETDTEYFDNHFEKVYEKGQCTLYKVK